MSNLKKYKIFIGHFNKKALSVYYSLKSSLDETPYFYWEEVVASNIDWMQSEYLTNYLFNIVNESDCIIFLPVGNDKQEARLLYMITDIALRHERPVLLVKSEIINEDYYGLYASELDCVKCNLGDIVNAIRKYSH